MKQYLRSQNQRITAMAVTPKVILLFSSAWIRCISITWEPGRNAKLQAPPKIHWLETVGWGQAACSLTSPSGYSYVSWSLRTTDLQYVGDFKHYWHLGADDSSFWEDVHYRTFNSIPGLYTTICQQHPQVWHTKMSLQCLISPREQKSPMVENHWSQSGISKLSCKEPSKYFKLCRPWNQLLSSAI